MRGREQPGTLHSSGGWSGVDAAAVLAAMLIAVLVGPPLAAVSGGVARAVAGGDFGSGWQWLSAARSVGVPLLIAVLAALLSMPIAVVLAGSRSRRAWAALLLTPVFMPMYLVYAGWGVARSPETVTGDWLVSMGQTGHRWVPVWAGYALSVVGLAVWAVPLAALVIGASLRRVGRSPREASALEGPGLVRGGMMLLGEHLGAVLAAIGLVSMVMLGSAVPLHLAQLETHAIAIWRELSEREPERWGGVWLMSWPLVIAAVGAAVLIVRALAVRRVADAELPEDGHWRVRRSVGVIAALVVASATVLPLGLFAWTLRDWASIGRFWSVAGEAVAFSASVAASVGGVGLLLGAAMSLLLRSERRWHRVVAWMALVVLLIAALLPGVLIGSAIAGSVVRGFPAVVAAHVLRFGAIGALVGVVLVRSEPASFGGLRRVEGAGGVRAWWSASFAREWPALVGGGLVVGLLSFHEIEAAVLVQPPGPGNLARWMLDQLHFARVEAFSAGAVQVIGAGLVLAGAACVLLFVGAGANRRAPDPEQGS